MRKLTSARGRRQFSVEKAYSVMYFKPMASAASMTSGTASPMPTRCPSVRGRRRAFAQRPLPSMMIATWLGSLLRSIRAGTPTSLRADGEHTECAQAAFGVPLHEVEDEAAELPPVAVDDL